MSEWNDGEYLYASFAVERARRYHSKMLAYYEWCYYLIRAATALTGTASFFVVLAKDLDIAKYLTGVVAASAALDSIFRFNRKARIHDALCRRFTDLSGKIAGWEATPANLKKARTARLQIEKDERPVRRLIDLQAHNEELRARGRPENQLLPLSWLQRKFGYIWTFGLPRLERWRAVSEDSGTIEKDEPVIVSALPHVDEATPQ
ncbi:hypothetical protein [Tardiphaga sp.]|uniref:hypothetical protein n=1 Tax=Tardiphaga sp. TaxID=1926292 RepID=UPI002625D4CF|nr:hypothetical protein [Tardiphaga sp.]MDB5616726.1 hypothetical protein [Tardiphaga sp.]